MKVYTKTGDTGDTSLFGGSRVKKNHIRLETYGSLDELNSFIGLIRDSIANPEAKEFIQNIQARIFDIGSVLANEKESKANKVPTITELQVASLEKAIDEMDKELQPMKFFILPGGHPISSYAQIARTVCRRCERLMISLHENFEFDYILIKYINRLSDYLFVLARYILKENKCDEIPWIPNLE